MVIFFSYMYTFYFLSYLIALSRTSSKTLNRSGEQRCPCFVPDLKEKASSLSNKYDFYVDLPKTFFMNWEELGNFFQILSLLRVFFFPEGFYHDRVLDFVNCFCYVNLYNGLY